MDTLIARLCPGEKAAPVPVLNPSWRDDLFTLFSDEIDTDKQRNEAAARAREKAENDARMNGHKGM